MRYQCTRQPDISLCAKAFADGLFPTGMSARDFVRLEASSEQRVPLWVATCHLSWRILSELTGSTAVAPWCDSSSLSGLGR